MKKIVIAIVILLALTSWAGAENNCLGSCWACMHGCTEQERVEKCCPVGTKVPKLKLSPTRQRAVDPRCNTPARYKAMSEGAQC